VRYPHNDSRVSNHIDVAVFGARRHVEWRVVVVALRTVVTLFLICLLCAAVVVGGSTITHHELVNAGHFERHEQYQHARSGNEQTKQSCSVDGNSATYIHDRLMEGDTVQRVPQAGPFSLAGIGLRFSVNLDALARVGLTEPSSGTSNTDSAALVSPAPTTRSSTTRLQQSNARALR
jgi:hypothetical protein